MATKTQAVTSARLLCKPKDNTGQMTESSYLLRPEKQPAEDEDLLCCVNTFLITKLDMIFEEYKYKDLMMWYGKTGAHIQYCRTIRRRLHRQLRLYLLVVVVVTFV